MQNSTKTTTQAVDISQQENLAKAMALIVTYAVGLTTDMWAMTVVSHELLAQGKAEELARVRPLLKAGKYQDRCREMLVVILANIVTNRSPQSIMDCVAKIETLKQKYPAELPLGDIFQLIGMEEFKLDLGKYLNERITIPQYAQKALKLFAESLQTTMDFIMEKAPYVMQPVSIDHLSASEKEEMFNQHLAKNGLLLIKIHALVTVCFFNLKHHPAYSQQVVSSGQESDSERESTVFEGEDSQQEVHEATSESWEQEVDEITDNPHIPTTTTTAPTYTTTSTNMTTVTTITNTSAATAATIAETPQATQPAAEQPQDQGWRNKVGTSQNRTQQQYPFCTML